ncbi:MAG: hypothetical protein JXB50_16565 [Spirochaetes bacterium]|nr:hypothetical protein [Spirochaetota bacterium]
MKNILPLFKERKFIIIILSSLLFIQIILFIYFNVFSFQSIKSRAIEKKLLSRFDKNNVIALEISDIKNSLVIKRDNGNWYIIKEKKILTLADAEKVNLYLDILDNLNQGIIRDSGEESETIKKYGFLKNNIKKIIIKSLNRTDYTIYIGASDKIKGTSYIRLNSEKVIRELKSDIAIESDTEPVKWAHQ